MISEQALAAVTYVFPIQMLLISFEIGTGVGINSLISGRLGQSCMKKPIWLPITVTDFRFLTGCFSH